MNPDSTLLFENVPTGLTDVLGTTFSVFVQNWKSLVVLTLAQLASFMAAALILFGITFLAAGAYFVGIMKMLQNNGGLGRRLLDHFTVSGASRLLEMSKVNGYGQYYNNDDDFDIEDLLSAEFIITMIFMYIMWVVILALIASIYQGAFTHTLAEIYAGGTPTAGKSIRHGMSKMCQLFTYMILFLLLITGMGLVTILPAVFVAMKNESYGAIFLGAFVFVVLLAIVTSGLVAAVPSIVVESKSATQAFGRSWSLCKDFLCFIFCCLFCYHLLMFIVSTIINAILNHAPAFISMIGHIFVSVLSGSIAPIIGFVLYMSVRIRSENVTQEDLAREIDSNVPLAHAVEMSPPQSKDSKGAYANLTADAEVL